MTKVVCAATWCRFQSRGICGKDEIYIRSNPEIVVGLVYCDDLKGRL